MFSREVGTTTDADGPEGTWEIFVATNTINMYPKTTTASERMTTDVSIMRTLSFSLLIACLPLVGHAFVPTQQQGRSLPCQLGIRRAVSSSSSSSSTSSSSTTSTQLFGDLASARRYVGAGMQAFREGRVQESIAYFDQAEAAEPAVDPFLWQRGLSYYYADEFDKASKQFRRDVKVNPLDVEEIVWDIASQLRARPSNADDTTTAFPLKTALQLPPNQSDRRPIMAVVYKLFQGQANEQALAQAGHQTGRASDEFYSLLYLGLFAETALHDQTKAENYLRQAVHTEYAQSTGRRDYMTDVARVCVFFYCLFVLDKRKILVTCGMCFASYFPSPTASCFAHDQIHCQLRGWIN